MRTSNYTRICYLMAIFTERYTSSSSLTRKRTPNITTVNISTGSCGRRPRESLCASLMASLRVALGRSSDSKSPAPEKDSAVACSLFLRVSRLTHSAIISRCLSKLYTSIRFANGLPRLSGISLRDPSNKWPFAERCGVLYTVMKMGYCMYCVLVN